MLSMRLSNTIRTLAVLLGAAIFPSACVAKGFINHQGETVFTLDPSAVAGSQFSEGLVRVGMPDTGWFFLNRDGKKALSCNERLEIARDFSDGLCAVAVRHGGELKWGFIDCSGNFVIAPTFTDVYSFSEGLAPVCVGGEWKHKKDQLISEFIGGKWGFIGKDGQFVIEPKFEYALRFSDGRAAVLQDGKAGFIDATGKLVIPPQYNVANSFSEGLSS